MRILLSVGLLVLLASLATAPVSAQQKKEKALPKLTDANVQKVEHVFKKTPEGELVLHVCLPAGWKATDRRPVIVFFFGGGWRNGSYRQFVPQSEYFASRGIVAVSADYRILSKHKTTPEKCVEDAKSAIRWVRANADKLGIDPDKIIASGGSAGGHLAAATALLDGFDAKDDDLKVSCKPNALVLYNPALSVKGHVVKDASGKDIAAAFWPNAFLKKGTPPAILFFGTADRLIAGGREFVSKSKDLANRAELWTAPEMPHSFFNRTPWLETTTRKADEFLQSLGYLTGKPTIEIPANGKDLNREKPGASR